MFALQPRTELMTDTANDDTQSNQLDQLNGTANLLPAHDKTTKISQK
jgi:hypothetical protein